MISAPMVLALVMTVVIVSGAFGLTGGGSATPSGQWATVAQYIDSFVQSQYVGTDDGEAGFITTAAQLKGQLDSNSDNTILGEGDDAALAPVVVDVLSSQGTWIPGTSYRLVGAWYTSADTTNAPAVRSWVQKREAAGFNIDIVTYCLTGHTESPPVMAYGAMGQADYFGTTTAPGVTALKWGRYGWNTGTNTYSNVKNETANLVATSTTNVPTGPDCSAETDDKGLVRCAADAGLNTVNTAGGTGAGVTPWASADDALYYPIDIRTTLTNGTVSDQTTADTAYAKQVPFNMLFSSTNNYEKIRELANGTDNTKTNVILTRTQHSGGIAAAGTAMLGYSSDTMRWGLAYWNTNQAEQFTAGAGYALTSTAIDTTPPTISNVVATPTADGGTITWDTTGDPATSKVQWSTTPGGPYTTVHDTILHASHTVTITGQTPGATIYYIVSGYDGLANPATPTTEASFVVQRTINPATDKVYYLPWYDARSANNWIGDWIGVVNMDAVDPADVEIRIGGAIMGAQNVPAGEDWVPTPQNYPGEFGGPVQVVCFGCVTNATTLVVNQRALYGQTFSEILAVESADLGKEYVFPWYDNVTANNVIGAWIMVTNADSTTATVEIYVGGTLKDTLTIPAGQADFYIDPTHTLIGGPVRVVTSGGTQKLVVSQRVLYGNSFNEILGQKIS
ncbi:MAG: fibronectin type III domain-containing protein [Actinobacteria bacterium]|nr:fibronectin type III domain-containing protein [Actinomycetota bacterium]